MCACGGASIDQLLESETRKLLERNQFSCRGDLVSWRAVEGPFVAAKKEARQPATQPRQNSFAV